MKRIIAMLLALSLLCSSGLFDIVAWAAEEIPVWTGSDAAESVEESTTPAQQDSLLPLAEFGNLFGDEPREEYRVLATDEATGLIYERLNSTYCEITGYEGNASVLTIPEKLGGYTVRSIGESAFSWNEGLEQVILPDTVERICDYAFEYCTNLEQINIPDCVEELGERAFAECSRLSQFHFPSALQRAGWSVWAGCADLETIRIPDGVTAIPAGMFNGSCITEITIPDSVESIGEHAFSWCPELTRIEIPESVTEFGSYIFENCERLEEAILPSDLESLPEGMFSYCSNLRSVELPEALTEICAYAFQDCGRLEELELPDSITFIGERAFADCIRLSQINYPLSLETVDGGIFSGCTELESIVIPEGVGSLPDHLFEYCDSLREVVLPSTLERIGIYTFSECENLTDIVLPESLTELGEGAFYSCDSLEQIEIPRQIQTIAPDTFSYCIRLVDVTLPEGLVEIGGNAFCGCEDLETITLPDSVEVLGGYCFADCGRLYQINYPVSLTRTEGSVFAGCRDLETIEVPEGVTELPENVFYGCDYLETVVLPSTLERIGWGAFAYCSALEEVVLPEGLTELGSGVFEECDRLRSMVIPEGITVLPESFFRGCDRLTSVTLSESMTEIGCGAFYGCSDLTGILLPDTLQIIGDEAFADCEKLSAVFLPDSLTRIGYAAFSGCGSMTEITIPESVTDIDNDAFWGIEDLAIRCHLNSQAAAYAIRNGISIVELSGESADVLYELDTKNSTYRINYDGLSASGNLSLVLQYAFKTESWASPNQLIITIPGSAQLLENTLTLDGELCTEYEYYEEDGELYLPVTESEGVVRFSIKPLTYEKVTSVASIEFYDELDQYRTEIVGVVYASMPILTVSAQEEVSEDQVDISGVTMPSNTVTFFVNGEETGTAIANRLGDYSATLNLKDASDGKRYTVRAETTDADGNLITAETIVIYRAGTPTITEFTMEHSGQTFDLDDILGLKPSVTFVPDEAFRFVVKFDHAESIESLFIVSTRSNTRKYMKAQWDESLGAYVAEGFFDPADTSYVPGTISIEYVRTGDKISFETGFDFTSEESLNEIPDDWKDANVIVNDDSDHHHDVTIEKSDGSASIRVITTTELIPFGVTPENAHEYGFTQVQDDYGNTSYVRYYEDDGAPRIDVLDWAEDIMYSQTLDILVDAVDSPGISAVMTAYDLISTFGETFSHDLQFQQMRNDIINSNMTKAQKEAALANLEEARELNAVLGVTRMAGTLFCSAVGTALFGPVGGIVFGVAWKLCDKYLGYLQECNVHGVKAKSLWSILFGWVIDPSGYVYDARDNKRLSGVTVTAYWIPYDDSVDNFWGAVPDDSEYGEMWDASEYSQMNPLVTDQEGRYAWDVPEGWWRVEYELDGYETIWSDWMPVPPPQTEVNIGLVATDEDHEHSYLTEIFEPTCEDEGYTLYSCECGESYEDDFVDPLGHDMGQWYTVTDSTCIEEGEEQSDCSRCDHCETRALPLTDHAWDEGVVTSEPTEEDEGEMLYTCTECGETRTEIIPVLDHVHDYTAVVTDPTCTEGGYTTYTCACGESYEDDFTDALGHEMGDWVESKAPGCTEPGTEIRGCDRCDYTETRETEPTGHSYTAVVTEATCTEGGYTTYYCACGESYVDDRVDALGHEMGSWVESKAPGCTEPGTEIRGCDRCDYTETREIELTGHDWTDWQVVREATEEAEGEEQRICRNCGKAETRSIPKEDHVHSFVAVVTAPTCTTSGYTTYTCACGSSYVDEYVSATGHSYDTIITEATCTEGGYTSHVCEVCGESYVDTHTSALGHDYEDGSCTRCGEEDPDYQAPTEPVENPFTDVPDGMWYMEPVLWAVEEGITSGTGAGTFSPDQTCTRAQVVTFLWRAFGQPEPEQTDNPFTDVAPGDYYYNAVLWAVENGITSGMSATTFAPGNPCTRGQVVTFLWRAMDEPVPENVNNPFADVSEREWFFKPVLWAVENGITAGMSPTTFAPSNPCTRAQVVTFLYRALKDK